MAELRATKRNPLLGLLADALSPVADYLSTSTNPLEDTGSDLSVTGLLGDTIRPVANTVNRMSYGEPLTTGRGMATQMRPDTRDALLAASPMGAGTKAAGRGVKAGAQALSPQAERMLMDTMRKMGGIKDITAYHGSPHKFDKFSLDKIGTGEGAQVYGHGLYFADSPDVAKDYMRQLFTGKGDSPQAMAQLLMAPKEVGGQGLRAGAAQDVLWDRLSAAERAGGGKVGGEFSKRILEAIKYTKGDINSGANFYKVDIPDEAVANMLLWDKPLSEQPEAVKRALQGIGSEFPKIPDFDLDKWTETSPLASTWYNAIARDVSANQSDVSKILNKRGIPGIRYFDAGSREAGKGSMNTVLFDDALVKILERNGVPMQGLLD